MREPAVGLQSTVSLVLGPLRLQVKLDVAPSETVAILGPNGAGKTTLLRVLAGLQPIDDGRVVLDGLILDGPGVHLPAEERPVGFVFQDYLLFPHLSAMENVAFGLRSRGLKRSQARRVALEWLERVGLGQYASSRPRGLSGGQAQRVALARALATAPRLLLLDEPLAALDASTRLETRRELRRHLAAYEGVRLIVTHDLLEAASLAERLVVIEEGRVVQTGTLEELSRKPRSRYVADLVGVNLLRGRAEGDRVMIGATGSLVVPGAGFGEVFAVVHPRAVALYRRQPEGTPRNVWQGVAESLDLEGERVRVKVGGPLPIVAEVTPAAVADLGLAGGGSVWVSVKATEISVYPV